MIPAPSVASECICGHPQLAHEDDVGFCWDCDACAADPACRDFVKRALKDGPVAHDGGVCDCETPGDWHRVANDFQRAMFDERARADRIAANLRTAEQELKDVKHAYEREVELADRRAAELDALIAAPEVADLKRKLLNAEYALRTACTDDYLVARLHEEMAKVDALTRQVHRARLVALHLHDALAFMRRAGGHGADHSTIISALEAYDGFAWPEEAPPTGTEKP